MENKKKYRELLPLVNDLDKYTILQEYAEHRIETLKNILVTQKDFERILELQGAITELKRFKTLRDEVIKEAK